MSGQGVMIVAGEVSGDIHAGNMLDELQRINPDACAFGVGGERLTAAGLDVVARTEQLGQQCSADNAGRTGEQDHVLAPIT